MSVVVADAGRIRAIRDRVQLPGRVMQFTLGGLASALETIGSFRPKVVAVDGLFAQTPAGAAFVDRVDALHIPGSAIRMIVQHEGRWVTIPRSGLPIAAASQPVVVAAPQPPVVAPPPQVVAAVSNAVAAAEKAVLNTRRAPRFVVRKPLDAMVESGCASLVDISVLGAQIVSQPVLRPSQKIQMRLPDADDVLNVVAQVAWATFEKPTAESEPYYRAGIEFSGAAQHALEDYRRRHCADQPIPYRGR